MFNTIPQNLVALDYHGLIVEWLPASSQQDSIAGYNVYVSMDNGVWEKQNKFLIPPDGDLKFIYQHYNPNFEYDFKVEAVDDSGNTASKEIEYKKLPI